MISNILLLDDPSSPYLKNRKGKYVYEDKDKLEPVWTILRYARCKLEYLEDEIKIIPKWLLDGVSKVDDLAHIYASLIALENSYDERNSKNVFSVSITLLDSILNLSDDLTKLKNIGNKLEYLISEKGRVARERFGGLSEDFFRGLNNSRLIRNIRVSHPVHNMRHDITFGSCKD